MKKKRIIIILLIIFIILLIPVPAYFKDGGTVRYNAVLWSCTRYHVIADENGKSGYNTGTEVRILFFEVYDDFPKDFIPLTMDGQDKK